ncbi:MAG: hypothetical protein KF681_00540 [Bdellovibrionaceae bacterium]|nr:hypothetical protein [Pseudobdellovibrionaceae bacterium]
MKFDSLKALIVVVGLVLGVSLPVQAYHHFIGYGYSSCMTCHYNGAGGGALNDYGRALFAAEITSRAIFPVTISDEKLGEHSKFLAAVDLPYWIRPAIKGRTIGLQTNPGSPNKTERWIPMQREVYLTLAADEENKYIFVGSMTNNEEPRRFSTSVEDKAPGWAMKEAYFRLQLGETSWIYAGQLDKVYGTREINHAGYQRRVVGMTQYDQSLGVIYQRSVLPTEIFIGAFEGNTAEKPEDRYKGASFLAEYEPAEKMRVGFSGLTEKSEKLSKDAVALTGRFGIGTGSAFSAEMGLVRDKNLATNADSILGAYGLFQSFIRITRGYNFLGELEWYRPDTSVGGLHNWRWNLGFLTFPLPRTEVRAAAVNSRVFSQANGTEEFWTLQAQLHWSL